MGQAVLLLLLLLGISCLPLLLVTTTGTNLQFGSCRHRTGILHCISAAVVRLLPLQHLQSHA
jgi:uncharacterized membrane protein HdeD (DUF308 family)